VAGDHHHGQAFFSRRAAGRLLCPRPGNDPEGFVSALLSAAASRQLDVILPTSDEAVTVLARRASDFGEGPALVVPEARSLALVHDKLASIDLARQCGLQVPETHAPGDEVELAKLAATLTFPCVLKPRRGTAGIGVAFPRSGDELRESWTAMPDYSDLVFDMRRPLVQQYIPGETHDVCVLCNRGRVVAAMTQRRMLTFPSSGGPGVAVETTDEPGLVASATTLLEALRWHGPAQVEFRVDPTTGQHWFGEVNGRLWGTLEAAIAAGFDVPTLACRMAIGRGITQPRLAPPGLRFRWPYPYAPLLLLSTRPLRGALRTLVAPAPRTRCDLDLGDPMPHVMEIWWALRRVVGLDPMPIPASRLRAATSRPSRRIP
jgi:biotin carboxylase